MTNQLFSQRIPPSGPLLGSPAVLVGGGQIDGRCWRAQGAGDPTDIPLPFQGTYPPIPGLESVPVDFRSGYGYDLSVDIVANGVIDGAEQAYQILPLMSVDGITWAPFGGRAVICFDILADGRLHQIWVPQAFPAWKFARVAVFTLGREPTADLIYLPDLAVLVIQEFTTA